jgi:predicted MFS family arabinose efflux permease
MGYLELLRTQPAFRRLWLGQIVSEAGDWLQFIALVRLFPTAGRGAELLAGLLIVRMIPSIIWAPLAGVVADRFRRGRVMVVCDLLRAAVVLGYLGVRGPEDIGWIYALLFAQESITAFFEPARAAALPQVAEPRALLAANSLSGATWSAMLAIGSAAGGLLTAGLGPRGAFVADALSFAASAVLIGSIGIPAVVRDAEETAAHAGDPFGLHALREGAAYLSSHRPQAAAALVKGLWGTAGGIIFLLAIYAAEVFTPRGGESSRALGLLYAGRGVGALVGPLIFRRVWGESARSLRRSIQVGLLLAAAGYAALTAAPSAIVAALFLVCAHMGGSTCWVNSTQLLQLTVPNALQGRVFAVDLAAVTLTMALSSAVAGALIGRGVTSLRGTTFVMVGAMLAAALLWAALMRRLGKGLEAAAEQRPEPRPVGSGPTGIGGRRSR